MRFRRALPWILATVLLLIPGCAGRDHDLASTPPVANGDPVPTDADECGTIAGIACPEGEVCEYEAGTCNVADLGGRCVKQPELCAQIWRPVCGCDGKTYSSDCHRLAAGARKDRDGECEKAGG